MFLLSLFPYFHHFAVCYSLFLMEGIKNFQKNEYILIYLFNLNQISLCQEFNKNLIIMLCFLIFLIFWCAVWKDRCGIFILRIVHPIQQKQQHPYSNNDAIPKCLLCSAANWMMLGWECEWRLKEWIRLSLFLSYNNKMECYNRIERMYITLLGTAKEL